MYAGRSFPAFEDNSARVLGFDLTAFLQPGEIIEFMTPQLVLQSGVDNLLANDPNVHFIGAGLTSGNQITQSIAFNDPLGALAGNSYALSMAVTTSAYQTVIPWASFALTTSFGQVSLPTMQPPASAQVIVIPAPGPKFTLPTLGGYAGQDFPIANQGEALLYGFDFSPALSPSEAIASAYDALFVIEGTDAAVSANSGVYFTGTIGLMIAGNVVQQMIVWPSGTPNLAGNVYTFGVIAQTSFNQSISTWARISVGGMV